MAARKKKTPTRKKTPARRSATVRERAKPPRHQPIQKREEEVTEVVGGALWIAFGCGIQKMNSENDQTKTVEWLDVVKKGRFYSRGYVYKNRRAKDWSKAIKCANDAGAKAWKVADKDNGRMVITAEDFKAAWEHVSVVYARALRRASRTKKLDPKSRGGACT